MTQVTIDLDLATAKKLQAMLEAGALDGAVKTAIELTLKIDRQLNAVGTTPDELILRGIQNAFHKAKGDDFQIG
jgi:hypothetical protein